jgi:hypothetical protein
MIGPQHLIPATIFEFILHAPIEVLLLPNHGDQIDQLEPGLLYISSGEEQIETKEAKNALYIW